MIRGRREWVLADLRRHPEAAGWSQERLGHELLLARETVNRALKEIRS